MLRVWQGRNPGSAKRTQGKVPCNPKKLMRQSVCTETQNKLATIQPVLAALNPKKRTASSSVILSPKHNDHFN